MRALLVLSLVASAACFSDGSCDPDQIATEGICIPTPLLPDAQHRQATTFGKVCTSGDECGPDTDACAVSPGAVEGFCTRVGCLAEPAMCPEEWTCFDASAFLPDFSLCVPPQ
jgi:hypothetical protein